MMARVTMYKKDPCPYCTNAQRLLNNKGIEFQMIDLTDKPKEMMEMKEKWGWSTVPIILIDGKLIGGYTDLKELNESGKLDELLGLG